MNKEVRSSVEEFFLNSGSEQLQKIYGWAQARMVAPWAVLFGVLLRVAASVPPTVQLPPVIGGRASLNLLCAFVGSSGAGKGNSTKVAALAWPTNITTLSPGSGQGIAETFTKRNEHDDIVPVIFDVPEIDTIAGLSSAHSSILLPTVKSLAMGEQLGQANAAKDTRRNVPAHSYRACLSVGAQPGHTDVIFNDATGGTPQRFLWVAVTDPDIQYGEFSEPEPLVTDLPIWTPGKDGVVEVAYSVPEIKRSIVEAHIARNRGEGDALDGHALLTRCKVAALMAIMHGRAEVTEWDWDRSAVVMAVSDRTRHDLIRFAQEARHRRVRDEGRERAVRREGYEEERVQSTKNAIVEKLGQRGCMAKNELRTSLNPAKREYFELAIEQLAAEGVIEVVTVKRGERYQLAGHRQGDGLRQGSLRLVSDGDGSRQGDAPDNLASIENHRSRRRDTPKVSCQKWFDEHLSALRAAGYETVEAFAVRSAGLAQGYSRSNIDVSIHKRGFKGARWALTG